MSAVRRARPAGPAAITAYPSAAALAVPTMTAEVQPLSPAGRRMFDLATAFAPDFAKRAARHDLEGSFAHENIAALSEAGYLGACVPEEFGGMGVQSVHDIALAQSRLARGDAATTIGVSMHLNVTFRMALRYRRLVLQGDLPAARQARETLEAVADGRMIIASMATEAGRELTEPAMAATRSGDGWVLNGRKIFCTISPAATHMAVSFSYVDREGVERLTYAQVPADAPGITLNDDWNALGMRASGSGSVTFENVQLKRGAFPVGMPVGSWNGALMDRYLSSGLLHAAPSLGIAEEAFDQALAFARKAKKGRNQRPIAERPAIQFLIADSAVDVAAMRASFSRAGQLIDSYFAANSGAIDAEAAQDAFTQVQCAKSFLNRAAVQVVDRALTISGGAGYMAGHPLSRHYRDVRAGGFMHPLAANAATEFIGRSILGLPMDND